MRLYVAIKIERTPPCKHVELHKFIHPDFTDKGFYRATGSLNAFTHGDRKRNRGNWSPTHLYVVKRWEEFVEDTERCREIHERISGEPYEHDDRRLPTFQHTSIWDFYKHEGYDYKKKKWLPKNPI